MAANQAGILPPPSAGHSTALRIGLSVCAVALVAALAMLHAGANHLALLGLATILVLLVVIMTEAMSPLIALIAVPIAGALAGGFKLDTGKFIVKGISSIAPVAGMFIFAILFFGVMSDAGMLDPIIDAHPEGRWHPAHPHRDGLCPAGAVDPLGRLRRRVLPDHHSRHVASLRTTRDG